MKIPAAAAALLLCAGLPASAQLGSAPQSPPPEGVPSDGGAGNPKGHYHELDALPDWGGIWFVALGVMPLRIGCPLAGRDAFGRRRLRRRAELCRRGRRKDHRRRQRGRGPPRHQLTSPSVEPSGRRTPA